MTSILIGVDDSPRSEDAVAFAGTLAAASSATVVLACAFPYDDTPSRVANPELRALLGRRRRRRSGAPPPGSRASIRRA